MCCPSLRVLFNVLAFSGKVFPGPPCSRETHALCLLAAFVASSTRPSCCLFVTFLNACSPRGSFSERSHVHLLMSPCPRVIASSYTDVRDITVLMIPMEEGPSCHP